MVQGMRLPFGGNCYEKRGPGPAGHAPSTLGGAGGPWKLGLTNPPVLAWLSERCQTPWALGVCGSSLLGWPLSACDARP